MRSRGVRTGRAHARLPVRSAVPALDPRPLTVGPATLGDDTVGRFVRDELNGRHSHVVSRDTGVVRALL